MNRYDIELAQANHRWRVAYRSIVRLGHIYKRVMQFCLLAAQGEMNHELSKMDLSIIQDKVQSEINGPFNHALFQVLSGEIDQISSDQNLSESTRQKLAEFWSNYLKLKRYVENPQGTINTYQAKCNELCERHDRLSKSLKVMLGVGDDED